MKIEIGNYKMSIREKPASEKPSTASLKGVLVAAVVLGFGILHVAGAMIMHNAATPRPIGIAEAMANRD